MREVYNSRRYLTWLAATVLVMVVCVLALVVVVDPYGLYHVVDREGFNSIKPRLSRYQDQIKLTHAVAIEPDVLILGNSRAEIGFDPEGPTLSGMKLSAYNLGIPGTGISTARGQLEYLLRIGTKPKLIVLGLEFLDFVGGQEGTAIHEVLVVPKSEHSIEQHFWRFDTLFSLLSLKDALRTLIIQHDKDAATISAHGFNPLNDYGALARKGGYYGIFMQRAREYARVFLKKNNGTLSATDFAHLDAVLQLAARYEIEVKLVIYPYHAQIMALFESAGLWPAFQEWKVRLTKEIADQRARYPAVRIELYDFSGYSSYNCEPIPDKEDRKASTRWYWEGGHFKKEQGELVLRTILSGSSDQFRPESMTALGMKLDVRNVRENQKRIAEERERCFRDYQALFLDSANLVTSMRSP